MKWNTLHDLYLDELRHIYDAEQQIIKAMPQLAEAVSAEDLRSALEEHMDQTKEHVERLDNIFESLEESPKGKSCKALAGLIAEARELIDQDAVPAVRDAGLIGCVQRIEHYEIALYGCLCAYAELLGRDEDIDSLQQTLDEERDADETLTDVAENSVNMEAAQLSENGEAGEDMDEEDQDEETQGKNPEEDADSDEEEAEKEEKPVKSQSKKPGAKGR